MLDQEVSKESFVDLPSRPFCAYRSADYAELNECLNELICELESLEGRIRSRSEKDKKSFLEAVRCIVLDMYVAWHSDPLLSVGIPLGNVHYTTSGRYSSSFLKWRSFKSAYTLLIKAGYIVKVKDGFNDRIRNIGRYTRIKASEKLIRLLSDHAKLDMSLITLYTDKYETVVLRGEKPKGKEDEKAPNVEYDDTDTTLAMRVAVNSINEHLQKQCIDINISDDDWKLLQARMTRDHKRREREVSYIDLTQKTLVRIFNNSDWHQGGRFYRGWWQAVPKEYRKYITINGKRTCEVDYSGLHPVLLYAEIGQHLDDNEDPYDVGLPSNFRPLIKETFNKMINATGKINPPKAFPAKQLGMTWKQLQVAIAERHSPIKEFFNTGHGLKMQRTDSEIAEAVMLRFNAMNYTCLPIHDSFVVHHALVGDLKAIMVEEFKNVTGHSIPVKVIEGHDVTSDANSAIDPQHAVNDWFNPSGQNAGYLRRQRDWYLTGDKRRGSA